MAVYLPFLDLLDEVAKVSIFRTNMAEFSLDASFIPALHKPPALLPISKYHDSLLYVIETYPVTIVIGQTGSGKTTQIPQYLEKAGWCADGKIIGITQVCLGIPQPVST